ncbi:hypothetical protein CRUP_014023, partial [Coryphaenoides rupestris]
MELYSWTTDCSAQQTPRRVSWSVNQDVALVRRGEQHALFLTADGQVLSGGGNSRGQLGRDAPEGHTTKPGRVLGKKAVGVACGQDHCLLLSTRGELYSWGAGGDGQLGFGDTTSMIQRPRLVPFPIQIPVVHVACGNYHSVAL